MQPRQNPGTLVGVLKPTLEGLVDSKPNGSEDPRWRGMCFEKTARALGLVGVGPLESCDFDVTLQSVARDLSKFLSRLFNPLEFQREAKIVSLWERCAGRS